MPQTRFDFGGDGPPLHIACANGFPPNTYIPLLRPLTDRFTVLSLPPRPLWTDPPPPDPSATWQHVADDLLAALDAHRLENVIGVGHSIGGVATMLAAIKEPGRFRGLVLLDPTIFPQRMLFLLKLIRMVGLNGRFPLAQRALRRRAHFKDDREAFKYWREKRLFAAWSDAALQHYVDGMLQPDGYGGVALTFAPEWEAHYFSTIYTDSWRMVPKLEGLLPLLLVRGTATNTFLEPAAKRFRKQVPSATYTEINGDHLFPQSKPGPTRAAIEGWLTTLDS
jgi:pimeloyl-ACP methyl ester carboxylesterase